VYSERVATSEKGAPAVRERRVTREAVVVAALRIVDTEGAGALSMRRVADEVGVSVMTLYGVVQGKQDLVEAVGELALADLLKAERDEGPWRDKLHALTTELYSALRDHPGVVEMVLSDTVPSGLFDEIRESMLAILDEAGLNGDDQAHALGGFFCLALGFAIGAAARARLSADEVTRLRRLHPAEFPHLTAMAETYPAHLSPESVTAVLERLIESFRPTARPPRAATRTPAKNSRRR
jgi:AcrR family transcriptional regulator